MPFLFALCLLAAVPFSSPAENRIIVVTKIDGGINPAVADYLRDEIRRAEEHHAQCIIVQLNTPGGLLQSTREIVTEFLTAKIPIVVYVSPQGGQSASAGVFITLAAHIAAMSPGTNIGAAHPVSLQGGMDSVMSAKVTNDAAAFIRSISEKRKRNVQWAEEAVRKSIAITETEAVQQGVVDLIAPNMQALLDSLEGRTVAIGEGKLVLKTANAIIERREMGWPERLLNILSDPNIAYVLMMIGMYGLLFELYNPGAIFPGIVGAVSLLLALYAMHTLPVNYAGVILIVMGIIMFVLELKILSHGMLTIGGVVCLLLGSLMLITTDNWGGARAVSLGVILPTILFTTLFFVFAIGAGIRAQRRIPTTGVEGLIGSVGITIAHLAPDGQIKIGGEIWTAIAAEGSIAKGQHVIVEQIDGLVLKVRAHVPK
ncbi:MAG: nodulation protein NfeD [Ignavibacteriales bacterium]|nr:nodulation protein NfeD [Ignavibacteriales bacterium]